MSDSIQFHSSFRSSFRGVRSALRIGQLFGFCLLLAAALRLPPLVTYVWDALRMRQWEQVPAAVLEADYRPVQDDGDPQVSAKYRYRFGGKEYEGSRVDIAQAPEIFGDFQQQMAAELTTRKENGAPAAAFVNPARPQESVLFPRFLYTVFALRLGLFVLFALMGGLIFALTSLSLRRLTDLSRLREANPDEPWLWRSDWANKRMRSTSYIDTRFFLGAAALYLLVVLPVALLVMREHGKEILSLPGVLFMLGGWVSFNMARHRLQKSRAFDSAELRLCSLPGLIGGPLSGIVDIPKKMSGDGRFRIILECVENERSESRRSGNEARKVTLWRDEISIEKTLSTADSLSTAVPVYFAIPFDCVPCDPIGNPSRKWLLKVGPDEAIFDSFALFDVPVFKTSESSPDYVADPAVLEGYETTLTAEEVVQEIKCRIEPLVDGGEQLRFNIFRWDIFAVALSLAVACWAGVAAIFYFKLHFALAAIPAVFAALITLGILEMLLWGSCIEIRPDGVTVSVGYAGLRRKRRLRPGKIADIVAASEFNQFYLLRMKTTGGKSLTIVKRVKHRRAAENLASWLREKLRKK